MSRPTLAYFEALRAPAQSRPACAAAGRVPRAAPASPPEPALALTAFARSTDRPRHNGNVFAGLRAALHALLRGVRSV